MANWSFFADFNKLFLRLILIYQKIKISGVSFKRVPRSRSSTRKSTDIWLRTTRSWAKYAKMATRVRIMPTMSLVNVWFCCILGWNLIVDWECIENKQGIQSRVFTSANTPMWRSSTTRAGNRRPMRRILKW